MKKKELTTLTIDDVKPGMTVKNKACPGAKGVIVERNGTHITKTGGICVDGPAGQKYQFHINNVAILKT